MLFRIFTLHPEIFDSFFSTSLIARGISKDIIQAETVNWRDEFGVGNYKQIDDKPFGGGHGMVLQADPIYNALQKYDAVSTLFDPPKEPQEHKRLLPNNSQFYQKWLENSGLLQVLAGKQPSSKTKPITKATISLTPRGFPVNQQIIEWLANFEELDILCGRYEGFDSRVSEIVDLELSLGNFVLNGGEVATMAMMEAVSRLIPDFVTKSEAIMHDSFSTGLNEYTEQKEFVIGKRKLQNQKPQDEAKKAQEKLTTNLFDDILWKREILPKIEHPQYTRGEIWQNYKVPEVLLTGNHKKINDWRRKWY